MQRRVLIRTRGLASFRQALVDLAGAGDPLAARRRAIVVPTRAAASLLRLTIEQHALARGVGALICPDLVTRDEWLVRMLASLPSAPRWLSRIERLVLLEHGIRATLHRRPRLAQPFELRPGLVAAMLDFYDELRRRQRGIRTFARTIFDDLRVERGTDRGSESLIDQTRFLGFAFLAYERAARASGGVDEHDLTRRLLDEQPPLPFEHLVIAVADHPADPRGLWPVDFDLIGRLGALSQVDVVMTDEAHDAGFRARVEQELPGIEEVRAADVPRSPVLVTTSADEARERGVPVVVCRDREEELRQVARHVRARAAQHGGALAGATAIVFHRPLPYLYLAQQVLTDARVPYQAFDALPLAAEPYAALLDLALAVSRTDGARDAVLALLRSPLASFVVDGAPVTAADAQALDLLLTERRVTGGAASFAGEVEDWAAGADPRRAARAVRLARAARAAADATRALADCRAAATASAQVRCLGAFLRAVERLPAAGPEHDRFRRARAAVLGVLDALADAFERYDDRPRTHDALAAAIYHAVEDQTFAPTRGHGGVHLVDAAAARFGDFDDVFLVGLVETDWAERQRRNFFYSAGLLKALGWPQDTDQTLAQQAAFRDVLTLARSRTRLSAFQLDGETVVALSTMIDAGRELPTVLEVLPDAGPLFADEILTRDDAPDWMEPDTSAWLLARRARPDLDQPAYRGFVPPPAADVYRVSRVDRYVTCPFKYFAEYVLRLAEERPGSAGLTPLERGTFLHSLFEHFYDRWQQLGHGAITNANMPDAQALFGALADEMLERLPAADRALERMRIIGSVVAPGVADRVFELEAAASDAVIGRRLEVPIEGPFVFPVSGGLSTRTIAIKGKADRVDVLGDGSLRVIDYKLSRMPDLASSVQVAVYAHCVRQKMEAEDGRPHPVSGAMYLAFGDDRRLEGRLATGPQDVAMAVEARAGEFAGVVAHIEQGEFPPRPLHATECQWCGFAGVCRKEHRSEDDGAAESV
jgi:RecB family exonuclease